MAKLSQNKGNKAYIRQVNPAPKLSARHYKYMSDLPPRFFVFAYNGWKTAAALEKNFKTVSSLYKKAHIHGICNLYEGGSLFVRHLASGKGEGRFSKVSENGFRYFLMNLPTILDSMLPTHRLGLGFDQIYLNHYALAIE